MIKHPTMIMINFVGSFFVMIAPNGAATIPPINNPMIIRQLVDPMVRLNTTDSATVTKNSEKGAKRAYCLSRGMTGGNQG